MRSRVMTTLAAALIGAAAGVVAMTAPAAAVACPRGTGVTVVVGSDVRCDPGGAGKTAASNFGSTGHGLTYVQRQPGFVCRVDGVPASDPCVNTPPPDAYWSLWWSNGTSGAWTFSNSGAGSLKVPAGGWVGFSFQSSTQKKPPGVTPRAAAPAPKPSPKPSTKPGTPGTPGSPGSATSQAPAAATPTPTSTSTKKPTEKSSKDTTEKSPSPSASATAGAEASGPSATDLQKTSQDSGGNDPLVWVAGGLVLVLLMAMGAVAWRRRSAGGRRP